MITLSPLAAFPKNYQCQQDPTPNAPEPAEFGYFTHCAFSFS